VDELYVMARRVLLDALEALGDHRGALVLVGAQAVYLRVGEASIAVAPFTTDGDLAVDPSLLAEAPPLERALMDAGFLPKTSDSVGIWVTRRATSLSPHTEIAVDLLVAASAAQARGRRAARLPGHDSRAVRVVRGLEGAIVDADVKRLASLDRDDVRAFDIRVAGPAALLVAKCHKIVDRHGTQRESDKDALDILRLLRGTPGDELVARYRRLLSDPRSVEAATDGAAILGSRFADRRGAGVEMARRAVGPLADPDEIAASCVALASDLLRAVGLLP
jgi:hypothetical protein